MTVAGGCATVRLVVMTDNGCLGRHVCQARGATTTFTTLVRQTGGGLGRTPVRVRDGLV